MKSPLVPIGAIAAVALAVTGCAGSGAGSDGGAAKIEFQTNLGATDPILDALTELTEKYEADHPDVDIELVPSTDTYEADIKVRLASGDVPDIWATHGWSLLRYSEFLEPLQNQPWAKDFNPALAPAMKNDAGEFFALPIDTDVAGIVYNQTVLETAGIDPASLTDWASFTEALPTLDAAGVIPISSSGKDNWFAGNVADFMASGGFTDDQLDGFLDGEFDKNGYAALLDHVAGWQAAGYFNPDYSSATMDDLGRALAEGTTAFVMVQNYLVTTALGFDPAVKLGYMPIPSDVGSPFLVGGEGRAFGVAKDSEHKEQALDYLAFLAEPENLSVLASEVGGIPGLTNATSDLGGLQSSYDQFVASGNYPLMPYFDRVYLPNGMWDTMVSTTDSVITGQGTVDQAVDQMATDFDSLFEQ
ncbi:ABC transporter substrate-binding protein [Microbacterium sp. NPDC058389]|uniref:ABC transporter substrate-binding protein n=1 Tax=Microbacterium sp. NPDC058389 TaxID=3346475 RepID=UPI00366459ED